VIDGDDILAMSQRPSYNILRIDRSTAVQSVVTLDFSLLSPDITSLFDAHKVELAPNGDLLVAAVQGPYPIVGRIDLLTGLVTSLVTTAPFVDYFIEDMAIEDSGGILVSGGFGYDQTPFLGRVNASTGALTVVSSGGMFDSIRAIAVVPVPEPSTLVLALLGLAYARRRL